MKIALAQINTTVGDLEGNSLRIIDYIARAEAAGAELAVFPEMAVTGYPPEDLLLKEGFIAGNLAALERIAAAVGDMTAVVGFADRAGKILYNAAAVMRNGRVRRVYRKNLLPNYGVFDEKRYFEHGCGALVIDGKLKTGVAICEDIWYPEGPLGGAAKAGARLAAVLNASPYHAGKVLERERLIVSQARRHRMHIAYVNLVGGQDELVFDGYSMVASPEGKVIARAKAFSEELLVVDIPEGRRAVGKAGAKAPLLAPDAEVYQALVTGLRDYVGKNGFKEVVIGLSGGIDSALVAALAADALGREKVHGVYMPSRYSSDISEQDARNLARNLGLDFRVIPIENMFSAYLKGLAPEFEGRSPDITEENLQARIRGSIMMALSNKFGWLVLTTGNKSEMSTGYATLYGDMAGGLAVIKDVPKMLVYRLCRYRNTLGSAIPKRVLIKAPTAELRPNQKDSDSLPPYKTLDPILKLYIEDDRGMRDIVAKGFSRAAVERTIRLVDRSEYKRRQSPPGIKITPKAFGRDRRMPITNKFTEKQ